MTVSLKPVSDVKIGVIGLGRTGRKILERMRVRPAWDVDAICYDCDLEVMGVSNPWFGCECLGVGMLHGLGCGGQVELGQSVAFGSEETIRAWLAGKSMVLMLLGAGGGFSGGFAPEVADWAREMGIPVLCVACMPFSFEGISRIDSARRAIDVLRESSLAVVTVELDDMLLWAGDESWAQPVIELAIDWMQEAASSVLSLILEEGLFAFDLTTLRQVFDLGFSKTLFITGEGEGEKAVDDAIQQIMGFADFRLPDSEVIVDRMLVSLRGGASLGVADVNRINQTISKRFRKPARSFFGATIEEKESKVTIGVFLSIGLGGGEQASASAPDAAGAGESESGLVPGTRMRPSKPVSGEKGDAQGYFDVLIRDSNRGVFEDTEPNLVNGEDLDVPTFLRRGIRIKT
ncbi:MAG: hypothetical protein PHF70_02220 [Opitutales bacterium]|nr:hypothetical protein [Opitutales bacterium]